MTSLLHVDDDPRLLKRSVAWFRERDVEALSACSAADGVFMLERESFDCVVTDAFPDEATSFVSTIRRLAPDATVVVLTDDPEAVSDAGAVAGVVTPRDPSSFPSVLSLVRSQRPAAD